MKRNIFYLLFVILLSACQQEEFSPQEETLGYLSIDNISVEVKNMNYVSTKAEDADFYVKIDGNGQTHIYAPGEVPREIALDAGNYTVSVYNYETYQEGKPLYSTETSVTITAGEINYISIQVPLQNVGIRLVLPDNFEDYFTYTFSVTQGEQTQSLEDGETYYFESAEFDSIFYAMNVTNKDNEKRPADMGSIDVENGNIYVITYDYATESLSLLAN